MAKYVLSDVHGRFDKFMEMVKLVNLKEEDTLYILGDVIDRGADSIKTLQYIINSPNMKMCLGNHELMFLQCLHIQEDWLLTSWFQNGGESTYRQYQMLSNEEKREIELYLLNLDKYFIVDDKILVHAGYEVSPTNRHMTDVKEFMESQEVNNLVWSRESFYNHKGFDGYTTIFGHTITANMFTLDELKGKTSLEVWEDKVHKDKIGIDCGAIFDTDKGGRLACIRLDDMEVYYV